MIVDLAVDNCGDRSVGGLERLRASGEVDDRQALEDEADVLRIPVRWTASSVPSGQPGNEIRSQSAQFATKSSGCSAREAVTRSFASIEAHLSRHRLRIRLCLLVPGARGARNRSTNNRISANIAADRHFRELEADVAARADHLGADLDQLATTILSFGDPTPLSVGHLTANERIAECCHSYLIGRHAHNNPLSLLRILST